jgi:hypothetical protein
MAKTVPKKPKGWTYSKCNEWKTMKVNKERSEAVALLLKQRTKRNGKPLRILEEWQSVKSSKETKGRERKTKETTHGTCIERLRVVCPLLLTSHVGNGDPDKETNGLLLR